MVRVGVCTKSGLRKRRSKKKKEEWYMSWTSICIHAYDVELMFLFHVQIADVERYTL